MLSRTTCSAQSKSGNKSAGVCAWSKSRPSLSQRSSKIHAHMKSNPTSSFNSKQVSLACSARMPSSLSSPRSQHHYNSHNHKQSNRQYSNSSTSTASYSEVKATSLLSSIKSSIKSSMPSSNPTSFGWTLAGLLAFAALMGSTAQAAETLQGDEEEEDLNGFKQSEHDRFRFLSQWATEGNVANDSPVKYWHSCSFPSNAPIEDRYFHDIGEKDALFVVCDGHSGTGAAEFTMLNFIPMFRQNIVEPLLFKGTQWVENALRETFAMVDTAFLRQVKANTPRDLSGACVVSLYTTYDPRAKASTLYVANAGDCRAVSGRVDKDAFYGMALSLDHTCGNPAEAKRLENAHPDEEDVCKRGRIKGFLEPSRGVGDVIYKEAWANNEVKKRPTPWNPPYTTSHPDVLTYHMDGSDRFVALVSDGVTAFMQDDEIVKTIEEGVARGINPSVYLVNKVLARAEYESRLSLKQMLKLPAQQRRRFYDDTTVTIVWLTPFFKPGVPVIPY